MHLACMCSRAFSVKSRNQTRFRLRWIVPVISMASGGATSSCTVSLPVPGRATLQFLCRVRSLGSKRRHVSNLQQSSCCSRVTLQSANSSDRSSTRKTTCSITDYFTVISSFCHVGYVGFGVHDTRGHTTCPV